MLLVLAACSDGGGDGAGATVDADVDGSVEAPDLSGPPDLTNGASTAPATDPDTATAATLTTDPPVVPEPGVPGLDSNDVFCRSWSEFGGSFQALALAASLAADPLDAARVEVAAAAPIVAAVVGLDEHLPDELEAEREAFTVGLVGPMRRRADAAVDAMRSAGLDDAEISAVGDVWLVTLDAAGLDEPIDDVPIDPAVAARFEAAVAAFAAARPSIVEDPSLITDASTPRTFQYLAEHCPDQGTLGGNDVVGQP